MTGEYRNETMSEREEIEMLLPWYATGKLEAHDYAKVEAYLSSHPEMASQLEMIGDDIAVAIQQNEAAGSPSAGSLSRLMDDLDEQFGAEKTSASQGWLSTQLSKLGQAFEVPAVRYAGIAAALVIVVQATAIGSLTIGGKDPAGYQTASQKSPAGYQTASGPSEEGEKTETRLLISFVPEAKVGDISKLLETIEGTIVSGPRAGGLYEIKIIKENLSEEQIDDLIEKIGKETSLVDFVSTTE